jgi:hypothetical protein
MPGLSRASRSPAKASQFFGAFRAGSGFRRNDDTWMDKPGHDEGFSNAIIQALRNRIGLGGLAVVKLGGSVVRSPQLNAARRHCPARARSSSPRRAWPTRFAAQGSSALATARRTASRCSPWISSPGPWLACAQASRLVTRKRRCAGHSRKAASRSGRRIASSPTAPTFRNPGP